MVKPSSTDRRIEYISDRNHGSMRETKVFRLPIIMGWTKWQSAGVTRSWIFCRGIVDDPFNNPLFMPGYTVQPDLWPEAEYPYVYNYLIHSISPYNKDLKAYKRLVGFMQFFHSRVGKYH